MNVSIILSPNNNMNTIDKEKTVNNKIDKEEILWLYNLLELISKHLYTKGDKIEIWNQITISLEEDSYQAYESTETTSNTEEEFLPFLLQRNRTIKSGSWSIIIQDWDKINKKIDYKINLDGWKRVPSIRLYLSERKKDKEFEDYYYHIIDNLSNITSENNNQKKSFARFRKIINGIGANILSKTEIQSQEMIPSRKLRKNSMKSMNDIIELLSSDNKKIDNRIDML